MDTSFLLTGEWCGVWQ